MFLLAYIYSVIVSLFLFIGLIFEQNFGLFLAAGSIFILLYTNLIIMCKYTVVFAKKIRRKEKLAGKEIGYLLISIAISIIVCTILVPMYDNI